MIFQMTVFFNIKTKWNEKKKDLCFDPVADDADQYVPLRGICIES